MSPVSVAAYLVLFAAVASLFLVVALFIGRLLRSNVPTPEKLKPYECGEPAVGTSFIQFDLRFYVVALVFLIFEVEVALFFPAATIFGKATQLMDPRSAEAAGAMSDELGMAVRNGNEDSFGRDKMFDVPTADESARDARTIALASMADLGVFFFVILLGFAYVWWRGDLDWVRAIGSPQLRVFVGPALAPGPAIASNPQSPIPNP